MQSRVVAVGHVGMVSMGPDVSTAFTSTDSNLITNVGVDMKHRFVWLDIVIYVVIKALHG